ncbi:alpha/beta hydrolase [Agrobacterium vitis]|uniref:RBBP9/YdeN family alpha/beta hydrolase n=1 Tax=Agrobacterium vitis TaxID=373 RepID=UPI00307DB581
MFFYPCRAHTLDARHYGSQISGMKASQAEILIVPGYTNSGPDHWQSRWEGKLSTARRVEQAEWAKPVREDWVKRLVEEVNRAEKPVVLVGHSLGVPTIVHAVPHFQRKVAGAFLVAPPDVANSAIRPRHLMTFGPYPRMPLPFPTLMVASRNDPFGTYDHAEDIAKAWGALLVDAGEAGHLNAESGHGPWPEGTMVFAQFLSKLSAED